MNARNRVPEDGGAGWAPLAEVVDEVEAYLDVVVTSIQDRVVARVQARSGALPASLQQVLRRALSAIVRDAVARLRAEGELPQEMPPDLLELARSCADTGCELTELADVWLVGQEVFWDGFQMVAERTLQDTALCWDVIKAARGRLRGNTARMSGLFGAACEREVARGAGTPPDGRLRAVSDALEGYWVEADELGYDLAHHHVAVVADTPPTLIALARHSERQPLLVQAPDGAVWGWLGGSIRMSNDDLDALVAWQSSHDGQAAFGEPAMGIAGFAVSHHQALEARAIALATGQRAVRFADLRLLVALLRHGDLAEGFIERELGDLDDPGERTRELRETLRAYLEHGQSVSATAAVRRRDRKTIERQLRSSEVMLNHRVSDRSDELLIALRVADILRRHSQA